MTDPTMLEGFENLRPLAAELRRIQRAYRPFSSDYHAVAVSLAALDEAAEQITGRPSFYGTSGNHR